ncbi:MAG: VOC family protein [Alphaproteobacteria bacterium]|nr:VOC family protein [Alphaproteobacteria bacterium]
MDSVMHFEVVFDNKERAKKFYQSAFGWQFQEMPGMDYVMAMTAESDKQGAPKETGRINGGMMKKDPSAGYPLLVVTVKSIEAALKKVESSGGKTVLAKQSVGNFGYYARVKDTEGNVLGLWESKK